MTDGWGQNQIVALDLVADYWYDMSLLQCYMAGSEALAETAYSCYNTVMCCGTGQLHLVQLNLHNLCICSIVPIWSRPHTAMQSHDVISDMQHGK